MSGSSHYSSITHVVISVAVGIAAAAILPNYISKSVATLAAIVVAATLFVAAGWFQLWPKSASQTRTFALRQDSKFELEEAVVVFSETAALSAVIFLLTMKHGSGDQGAALLAVAAVFMSWAGLHLMYAIRYAGLYYTALSGGIDFNTDEDPSYRDFLYFAYNLGMTYQVSDTAVSCSAIRTVVLRHCLLSYVFGTVVLATAVNLFVGFLS